MLAKRLIKSNDAGGGGCTNIVDLYNPFPDGGGLALYQLNGDATDVSGNYDGTASNVTYGTGVFGQAGVFNGSNSKISHNLQWQTNSSFTISVWIKPTTTPTAYSGILCNGNAGADGTGCLFYTESNGKISFIGTTSNGSWTDLGLLLFGDAPIGGVWTNYVIVKNGSTLQAYTNGSLTKSASCSAGGFVSVNTLEIGGAGGNPILANSFNGSIDQVRIFSRALRPYEVEALYTEEYCTPTIVPSEHFNTVTYTGDSVQDRSITGVGFAPDFTWIKSRTSASYNSLFDTVRGAGNKLVSNETLAEYGNNYGGVSVFENDGFALNSIGGTNLGDVNLSGNNYVSWNFKAGGAAVTNTDGTITSQVSANTEAGFSIVSYTGNGSAGATIGHGLGVKPNMIIVKNRDILSNFVCYNSNLGATKYLLLNSVDAQGDLTEIWNDTEPTNSVYSVGFSTNLNANGNNLIAYCFAEVEGFSSFGSYIGTGTSGNTIVTGFEPAFVMIKRTNGTSDWNMWDNKRGNQSIVWANGSNAEATGAAYEVQFYENGFVLNATGNFYNGNGDSYIYMAFAADPTTVEPTLEDSFNTVVYSGNGASSQSITGVGFQPDMVWQKHRTVGYQHNLMDSVRGANTVIFPDNTELEDTSTTQWLLSFDNDGFTTGANVSINGTNGGANNMVAWNWKGAEIPAINSNGSIPSVVSANPCLLYTSPSPRDS